MRGVRGDQATPGEFRRTQNWIGPPGCTLANATYVPPPPNELMNCLAEWEPWLEYFLNGVARQSEDAVGRSQRINAMIAKWRRKTAGAISQNVQRVLDLIAENPFITTKGAASRIKVAFTTAQRAIDRLVKARILSEITKSRRDRVFCAQELLKILEGPARLTPS
jgi:ribosomal protein S25